jgi:hypothetical protein
MADTPHIESPFPSSPVMPKLFDGGKTISFSCHKGIGCWNACCANIDITLTPYDVLRLKTRLEMTSSDFLRQYTVPYELEKDGIAGIKFKPVEGGTACQFMRPEGCSVYEDRPTACRYYPVALISMRRQDEYTDTSSYALVKEPHCKGHEVERPLTIDEYRQEQGVAEYDDQSRGWRQLILKKMSSGPTIGKPSLRSRQMYFMACYDVDLFREFVRSEGFQNAFELDEATNKLLLENDLELMQFGFRFLKQVLFGEVSIAAREDAVRAREQRLRELQEMQIQRRPYDPADEVLEFI